MKCSLEERGVCSFASNARVRVTVSHELCEWWLLMCLVVSLSKHTCMFDALLVQSCNGFHVLIKSSLDTFKTFETSI